jgi:drug/metabolite transporter (DMT)-like permease
MNNVSVGGVPLKNYLILFLLAVIWSSSFMVIKVTVDTIPPLTLTAARLVLAAMMLGTVLIIKGEKLPRDFRIWKMCVLLGIFGNALPFSLISFGETGITSSQTSILMAVMPLGTVLLAHFFSEGERATGFGILGVLVGFGGIVILVGPSALKGLGGHLWFQLSVAGGAMSYSIATVLAKHMPPSSLLGRSVAVMICASIIMVSAAFVIERPMSVDLTMPAALGAVYLGLLPTAIATLLYFKLISSQGAGFMAYVNYLIPVLGVFWGAILLNETVTIQALAALVTILAGLLIANYRPRET